MEASYVADLDEGLVNRFRGSELEREAQPKAIEQKSTAATDGTTLVDLAKDNTTAMPTGLFGSLGHTDVTVTYDDD